MANIRNIITIVAAKYVGQKEIKGNMGFQDEEFNRKMEAVGHEDGQAWCAYFTELVWKEAYQNKDSFVVPELDKLFSASAVATFKNFKKDKRFKVTKPESPSVGSLVVWQKYIDGKPDWRGHIGVVASVSVDKDYFFAIEGNTNADGGREGIEVALKQRYISDATKKNGLRLIGYVEPVEDHYSYNA